MILLLALLLFCPVTGSTSDGRSTTGDERLANTLKNRTGTPVDFEPVTVEEMISAGPSLWSPHASAELEGWVISVHKAGPESCNCFDPKRVDTHILVGASSLSRTRGVVVEVTPRRPVPGAGKNLVGHHVLIRGWLFYDAHHEHQPGRATAWEIHPVTSIRVVE